MKDNRNITIIVLSVTAAILLTMFAFTGMDSNKAYADSSVKGGDYIIVNGSIVKGTDFVYVIDVVTKQLVVYAPVREGNNRRLDLIDRVDLENAFAQN